jgi:hypothetical protein
LPGAALAGPNAGGTLILHASSVTYTSDIQVYCGLSALTACSSAVATLPWASGAPSVFYAIAAFPPSAEPRLKRISFGIEYDSAKFIMLGHGTCADFEIADGGWPAPGTGTGQSWTSTQTELLTEAYWFAGYAYSEQAPDSITFALVPHPTQGGVFADDGSPGTEDSIVDFGVLGLGKPGYLPCPQADSTREEGDPDPQIFSARFLDDKTHLPVAGVAVVLGENYLYTDCPDEDCNSPQCSNTVLRQREVEAIANADGVATATFTYHRCWPRGDWSYETTVHQSFYARLKEVDGNGEYHALVLAYHSGTTYYVTREADLAAQLSPVLHKHRWDLQGDLADFRQSMSAAGSALRVFFTSGVQLDAEPSPSDLHYMYQSCGDADSYGGGTMPGIEFQFDPADDLLHAGAPEGQRPLYYHVFPTEDGCAVVQYWMYFNGNDERQMVGPGSWHEGDWEWVAVKVANTGQKWVPLEVNFYQHEGGRTFLAEDCWWSNTDAKSYLGLVHGLVPDRTHVHVWVAANGHGTYNRYEGVYAIHAPIVDDYYDHVDYNICDNPYGGHLYFPYDALVPMGEFTHPGEADGCSWLTGHWSESHGGEPGMDNLAFQGPFGQRHCPDELPPLLCTNPYKPLWFGAYSPVQAQGSHEWRGFTQELDGFGNGEMFTGFETRVASGSYLGFFVLSPEGDEGRVRFVMPSRSGEQTAVARIDGPNVSFLSENENREIVLQLQPDNTYVFDEAAAVGEGWAGISVFEHSGGLEVCTIDALRLDVAHRGSAGVPSSERHPEKVRLLGTPSSQGGTILSLTDVGRGTINWRLVDVSGRLISRGATECPGSCECEIASPGISGMYYVTVRLPSGREIAMSLPVVR